MNSFFTVHFAGPSAPGDGVVVLMNGHIFGGDSGYIYIGTYSEDGNRLSASVQVQQFVPGFANVFGGFGSLRIVLNGTRNGDAIEGSGSIEGNPSVRMTFSMLRRADLPGGGRQ